MQFEKYGNDGCGGMGGRGPPTTSREKGELVVRGWGGEEGRGGSRRLEALLV
jgi:hypothetical protein